MRNAKRSPSIMPVKNPAGGHAILRLAADLEGLPLALIVAGRLLETEASLGWGVRSLREEIAAGARLLASTP